MSKNFTFTLSLDCLIGRNFNSSMATARNGLIGVQKEIAKLDKQQNKIGKQLLTGDISNRDWTKQNSDLSTRIKSLNEQKTKFENAISSRKKFNDEASSLGLFGIGVYNVTSKLAGMIGTAADFEQSMSKVGAITKANSDEMAMLSAKAKELGRQTQFTAKQSADAMSYLGMAGWNAQEIAKGMPGLLNLAAAGGTDLARTADIVSDDLTAFGLTADNASHMADVFAYTITRTNTNVEMLGETMKYGAPVAHAFGVTMEETAALAGLMANSGIKASQAGTALRSGFLRLAGPPKQASKAMEALGMDMSEMSKQQAEAQAAMKTLGIVMSDNAGPRKMSAIITELRTKMQGLSKEERLATVGAIFGKNAATGWLAVLDSAPDKFDQLVNEMDKCDGEADRMAKTMNANASGAITRLRSAAESASIELAGVFLPAIADVVDGAAKYVGIFAEAASEHPELVKGIGLVVASMTAAYGVIKISTVAIAAYRAYSAAAAAGTWAWNVALSANPIGLVIIAVSGLIAAGYMLYKNWDTVSAGLVKGWNWIKDTAYSFINNIPEKAGYAVGLVLGWFSLLPRKLLGIISNGLISVGETFIAKAKEWGQLGVEGIIDAFLSLPKRLVGIVSDTWTAAKNAVGTFTIAVNKGIDDSDGSEKTLASNASGGIYGRGAFLTTFAERSGESAIPHTPTRRNISLLARTNEIMGNPLGVGSINFAPNITINGNASQQDVEQALDNEFRKFREMFARLQREQRRVSYE